MIFSTEAQLQTLSIHKSGHKGADETYKLSEQPVPLSDETLGKLLMQYFLSPFEKVNELYSFYHSSEDLNLNEIYHFSEAIFENVESFHENSQQITKQLHEVTMHPKVKSGEVYVAYFTNLQIDGELHDGVGIFKSENKETYLKVLPQLEGYELAYEQEAINIKKLDKGCLIFNTEKENGFKVAVIDQTNKNNEAQYWTDEFLQLKMRSNEFTQTQHTLSVYKNFITQGVDEDFELSKTDKIDLLNRSINYFKEKDHFDMEEFTTEVIGNPEGIESFKKYKSSYEEEHEIEATDSFAINDVAVKKQARVYKSILKLDRNFHIYIHGNKDLIEKGYDEERNMNYYKVYFQEEQ